MDPVEVEQAYKKYGPLVWLRVKALLRSNPQIDQEEVFHDVFVRALRSWDGYRGDCSRLHWLLRITTNLCLDNIKQHRWRVEAPAADVNDTGPIHVGVVDTSRSVEERIDLGNLLAATPTGIRDVAILYHVDRYTMEEIAEILGISRKTIHKRLKEFAQRARRRLGR